MYTNTKLLKQQLEELAIEVDNIKALRTLLPWLPRLSRLTMGGEHSRDLSPPGLGAAAGAGGRGGGGGEEQQRRGACVCGKMDACKASWTDSLHRNPDTGAPAHAGAAGPDAHRQRRVPFPPPPLPLAAAPAGREPPRPRDLRTDRRVRSSFAPGLSVFQTTPVPPSTIYIHAGKA